jgi:hypothetical protein
MIYIIFYLLNEISSCILSEIVCLWCLGGKQCSTSICISHKQNVKDDANVQKTSRNHWNCNGGGAP